MKSNIAPYFFDQFNFFSVISKFINTSKLRSFMEFLFVATKMYLQKHISNELRHIQKRKKNMIEFKEHHFHTELI